MSKIQEILPKTFGNSEAETLVNRRKFEYIKWG